jgi:diguanylate cyclase (GGDEF)-like protein/PAS domain S-box-containing protein
MRSEIDGRWAAQALPALAALRRLPGASVALFDADLRYLLVSGPSAGVPGVENAELEGRLIAEVQPSQRWPLWEPVARAALRGEEESVELMAPDDCWYRVNVGPWRGPEGRVEGGVAVVTDITERKRLEGLAGHLAAVVEASADAIIGKTVEGIIVSWNPGAEQLYGYSAAEAQGRSIGMLIPDGHDDELPALMRRLAAGEQVERFETVRRRKDGVIVDVSLTLSPILDPEGRVIGVSTVARDVTEPKRDAAALAEARADIDRFFGLSPDLIVIADAEGRFVRVNPAWESVLGYTPETVAGRRFADFIHPDDLEPTLAQFFASGATDHAPAGYENRYVCTDGSYRWIMWHSTQVEGGLRFATGRDVTEQKRLEQELHDANALALADSNGRYRQILETTPDGIWRVDSEGRTDYVNPRMAEMLGYSAEEMIGRPYADFMEPEWAKVAEDHMAQASQSRLPGVAEMCLTRKDGTPCWARGSHTSLHDATGQVTGALEIMADITQAKSQALELRSTEHFLAGLAGSIAEGIFALDRDGQVKFVNPAAERLLGWSSDELAVRFAHAKATDKRLSGQPLPEAYDRLMSPLTTGEAVRAEDGSMTRKDDRVLPVAYSSAPIILDGAIDGLVVVFTDITERKAEEERLRKDLEGAAWVVRIQEALVEDRFVLYQQPIIDVRTREVVRSELLIRMTSRDGEIIAPGRFLPTAEQCGLIAQIDLWVMRQACRIAADGRKVNFNISGKSLGSRDLITALAAELRDTGADPAHLVCEITETALAADEALAEAFVRELVDLGCEVALDDFGMGYGGFSYLKRFSFTELKIDMEFGRDLIGNPANQHVVKAIVSLAKGFGRTTVAEGIENIATLDLLQQYGVDYAQGYAFGKPAPIEINPGHPEPATAVQRPVASRRRRQGDAMCSRLARAYGQTMRTGDPATAIAVIDDALRHKLSAAAVQSQVIAPAMREIGELWERGGLTVAQEHLATALSHQALTRLYPGLIRQSTRQGDTVVVAGVHGEHHVLGLRMVADVFDGAGYDVRFLGPDVPESSLLTWVQEHEPAVVALGVTMPLGAAALARQLQTLSDLAPGVQLVIGGQGVPDVLREGAGVLFAADTERLTDYLDTSLSAPAPGELPRGIARGGVGFGRYTDLPDDPTEGLAARTAQTTAAVADAARGQARRAFVLQQLVFRDPLTELWNRGAFDDRYQELTVAGVLHPPTIVMIDVDHFKSINDRFGHDAGDRALIGVARGILGALRPGDFAARYGGDEFAVLLPDTPRDVAATIGERIRSRIQASMTDPPLTVSVGVNVLEHNDRRRASLDVDHAVYTAKEHGRNQVVFA